MDWTVRPYGDPDFDRVWAMERARDADGYVSAVVVRQAAALYPATFLVAEDAGEPAGFVIAAPSSDPGVGWVLRLKVREERRRRGCARALLGAAVDRLMAGGVEQVRLTVAPGNLAARALYAQLGFVEEARLPDYFGPGEARLLLVLADPAR